MTQNSNNQDELELNLAQGIIDLTKIVEENKSIIDTIKKDVDQADSTIKKWEKQLQDWDLNLGTKFDEINKQLSTFNENLEQQTQNAENKFEELSTQLSTFKENSEQQSKDADKKFEEISTQFSEIQQIQNEQDNRISLQQQTLEEQTTEIQARVQKEQFKTTLDEAIESINEKITTLSQNQETIQLKLKNHTEKTQDQFNTLAKTIELVGDGLAQLEQQNKNHAILLEETRESIGQSKQKLKELVSLTKEDQRTHFDNFSRIVESYNENIRTELTIMAQSLKEADTQILDEVSASFMPKKIGKELQKTIADLASELETEAKKTRDELVQGLQENVQEYEIIMEEQNTSIKNYQRELERFQDEILAIIDRKVNEKYEVVFSLLSQVAVQAEELALLIKTSEIQIPSSPFQKDQTSSDIVKDQGEQNKGTDSSERPTNQDKELNTI